MARGSSLKRKIMAWTKKANHGQKPTKHRKRGFTTWAQVQAIRKERAKG